MLTSRCNHIQFLTNFTRQCYFIVDYFSNTHFFHIFHSKKTVVYFDIDLIEFHFFEFSEKLKSFSYFISYVFSLHSFIKKTL